MVAVGLVAAALCAPSQAAALGTPAAAPPATCTPSGVAAGAALSTYWKSAEPADRAELPAGVTAPRTLRRARPNVVRTHVHVLRSPRGPYVTRARVLDQIDVLNDGFRGRQSRTAAVAPFRFTLASLSRTKNRSWDHMTRGSRAERRAKQALHRGDANDLNLYLVAPRAGSLGWSTSPQASHERPRMDGVVVTRAALPGGSRGRYSAGDVAVHETGHWFGLLHTFAGRCGARGDLVADTPAEARPSYTCPIRRDSCSGPGKDPVRNFMDYSYDSCMNHFTLGQVDRMGRLWNRFRAEGGPA